MARAGQSEARDRKIHWRCFHCGDTFTKAQERWAREHFGRDEGELPVCQMRLPGERHLLAAAWRIVGAHPSTVGKLIAQDLVRWGPNCWAELTDAGRAALASKGDA